MARDFLFEEPNPTGSAQASLAARAPRFCCSNLGHFTHGESAAVTKTQSLARCRCPVELTLVRARSFSVSLRLLSCTGVQSQVPICPRPQTPKPPPFGLPPRSPTSPPVLLLLVVSSREAFAFRRGFPSCLQSCPCCPRIPPHLPAPKGMPAVTTAMPLVVYPRLAPQAFPLLPPFRRDLPPIGMHDRGGESQHAPSRSVGVSRAGIGAGTCDAFTACD